MPKIRTRFRPWEEIEVPDTEAAAMAAMGLLAPDAVEEVNSSGSSEEGSSEEGSSEEGDGEAAPGVQRGGIEDQPQGGRQPRGSAADPRVPDPQVQPSSQEGQSSPEEGPTKEEGMTG